MTKKLEARDRGTFQPLPDLPDLPDHSDLPYLR